MPENKIELVIEGQNKFTSAFKALDVNLTSLKSAVIGLGVGALVRVTTNALDFASAIKETADRVDFSTTALQQWRFVAEQSGASAQTLDASLSMFSRTLGTAASGSHEAQKALARIGITLNDLNTQSPEQIFERTRTAISNLETAGQRNQIMFQLFGRQAKELSGVFSATSSEVDRLRAASEKMGAVMDEQTIAKAKKTKDELDALTTVIKNQLSTALVALGPLLVTAAGQIAEMAKYAIKAASAFSFFLGIDFDPALSNYDQLLLKFSQANDALGTMKEQSKHWWGPREKDIAKQQAIVDSLNQQVLAQAKLFSAPKKEEAKTAGGKQPIDSDYLNALQKQVDASSGIKLKALDNDRANQMDKLARMNLNAADFAAAKARIDQDYKNKRIDLENELYSQLGASSNLFFTARQFKLEEDLKNMKEVGISKGERLKYQAQQELQIEADKITQSQAQRMTDITNQIAASKSLAQQEIDIAAYKITALQASRVTDLDNQIITSQSASDVVSLSFQSWAASLKSWQETVSVTIKSTMDSMVDGISTAVGRAIVLGENLGEALKGVMQSVAISIISMLVKIGVQMLASWLISKFVTSKQAASELSRGLMAVYVNSFASAAAIPFYGWAMDPYVAAFNLATAITGASSAATIGQGMGATIGAAHGGMEDVPSEGTFLLNKGERVLSPQQNRDLTDFLEAGASGGVVVQQLNITIAVPDSQALIGMDRNDWRNIVARNVIPALDALDRMGVRQLALEQQRGN